MNEPTPTPRTDPASLLRQHGLRVTPQRLAIATFIFSKPMHVTARHVHEHIQDAFPSISLNTIYLTLGQFEACGLLNSFEVHGNTIFDSNTTPHNHACCNQCDTIIDLTGDAQPAEQPQSPPQLAQWQIQAEQHIWLGLCPACSHTA